MDITKTIRRGQKINKRILIVTLPCLLIIGSVSLYVVLKQPFAYKGVIPKSITDQVSFPLYYPTGLPGAYVVDKDIELNEGVVIMTINPPSGFKIFLTQQPVPAGFNYEDFKTTQINVDSTFSTSIGEVTLGVRRDTPVASLFTQQNWIFLNTSAEQASKSEFETIVRSLQLVKDR